MFPEVEEIPPIPDQRIMRSTHLHIERYPSLPISEVDRPPGQFVVPSSRRKDYYIAAVVPHRTPRCQPVDYQSACP